VRRTRYQIAQRWQLPLGYVTAVLEEFERRGLATRAGAGGGYWVMSPEGEQELDVIAVMRVHDECEELVLALFGVRPEPFDLEDRLDDVWRRGDEHDRRRLARALAVRKERELEEAA
jgi:hypothetical protein